MKKLLLTAAAILGFGTSSLAQGIPSDITVLPVTVGKLEAHNRVVLTSPTSLRTLRVRVDGCHESWATGEDFLMIQSRSGSFHIIRAARFFKYYNENGKNWDATIRSVSADGAICSIYDN